MNFVDASYDHQLYAWSDTHPPSPAVFQMAPSRPLTFTPVEEHPEEHDFRPQFPSDYQSVNFQAQHPVEQMIYRSASPASAPSTGSSPWSTTSFPTQEVMYHPDVDISRFNRGSRGSMNSLSLPSMRSRPVSANGRAYTPRVGARPHALSFSHNGATEEQPWNLISYDPFSQGNAGAVTGPGGALFLRSPTPTKRQRTNQACEKCRERKAKCNGGRPTCQRCAARGHICEYAKERRMRGPNRTGRRGSQADMDDPVDSGALLALDASEAGPESPMGSSPRSSSELDPSSSARGKKLPPGSRRDPNRARSGSGSPTSDASGLPSPPATARERPLLSSRPSVSIALPTLSNGNLSLPCPVGVAPRPAPESVLRYAQSMPSLGDRYGQDAFLREAHSTWPALDARTMAEMTAREARSSSEYPVAEVQTMHYNVSDVSSSSTPITPERFENVWPTDHSPPQPMFQFGHSEKSPSMLSTLPEFEGEPGAWTMATHDDRPVIIDENGRRNRLAY